MKKTAALVLVLALMVLALACSAGTDGMEAGLYAF